jgi:hypothetical protein
VPPRSVLRDCGRLVVVYSGDYENDHVLPAVVDLAALRRGIDAKRVALLEIARDEDMAREGGGVRGRGGAGRAHHCAGAVQTIGANTLALWTGCGDVLPFLPPAMAACTPPATRLHFTRACSLPAATPT